MDEIISVKIGDTAQTYTSDLTARTFTITPAPAAGTNTLELIYRSGNGERAQVTGMRFSELYNGQTDSRVFLYGDGTNKTIYSGIDSATGNPSAEYFRICTRRRSARPTPHHRHGAPLRAAGGIQAGRYLLHELFHAGNGYGRHHGGVLRDPVNRQFGNKAPGQVDILENNP